MANKRLFASQMVPAADTRNEAGGLAYKMSSEEALAQFACTGCFNGTFYSSADAQLTTMKKLVQECRPEFVAKTAVYGRKSAYMKDMPAFMLAHLLAIGELELLKHAWPHVIDNGRMLRNFVQIIRSGVLGRKSFGHAAKRLIQSYILNAPSWKLFKDSVGNDPSLADIIKMTHPNPRSVVQQNLFGYLLDKEYVLGHLPPIVQEYELFKKNMELPVPKVDFRMLTSLNLGTKEWIEIARTAPWHMTRMNLNTFKRHGVFDNPEMVQIIADRLRDPELIRKARAFPYQLLMAYKMVSTNEPRRSSWGWDQAMEAKPEHATPLKIQDALRDAMEVATDNVPTIMLRDEATSEGGIAIPAAAAQLFIFPDVSGSMGQPVTGHRKGATTKMSCTEVGALIAMSLLRKNPSAKVLPFDTRVHNASFNARDGIMQSAMSLARFGGGGTNCSLPLALLNQQQAKGDLVIYISDNQSWMDSSNSSRGGSGLFLLGMGQRRYDHSHGTSTMDEWRIFKKRNPQAKMVCIDLAPNDSVQAPNTPDILNIGGFSDTVFDVLSKFVQGQGAGYWTKTIEAIDLRELWIKHKIPLDKGEAPTQ